MQSFITINKNTLNKINLAINNLTLWQFVLANLLLAIAFFFSRIFANEITGTIYLFLFLILPMIGVVLAIKNIKNNYNLLIGVQFFSWFCGLSILNYLDKRFLTLDFDLFIFPQDNLLQNLLVIACFVVFGILFLLLTKYANHNKKALTPFIFIPILIEFYVDGLIGMVISFFLVGAMAIWATRLLLNNSYKKSQLVNLMLGTFSLIFFEINVYYQNQLTKNYAETFLNQVTEYKNKNGQYPNSETLMIDRDYVKYHFDQNTNNQFPYFYWQEFKNPYCRHRFNFKEKEWVKDCKD